MSSEGPAPDQLACPSCARSYPLSERFCAECGMPLVHVSRHEEEAATDSHERARKVKPQYIGGELVKVGWASNQPEAELIQGILLEEGIPSVLRRTRGFDVPHFMAGGPRDVLVSQSAYAPARELLATADVARGNGGDPGASLAGARIPAARLAGWIIAAAGGATAIVYALYRLSG
jgi:hypothetical protein